MPDRAGQVLFSYADPQAPPDVLFPEEHLAFLAFVSDEQERPAMLGADWSVAEAASLLLLLRQLLASWRRFNLQLLHRRPRSDAARPLISFLANTDAVRNVRTLPGRVGQRLTPLSLLADSPRSMCWCCTTTRCASVCQWSRSCCRRRTHNRGCTSRRRGAC